MISEDYKKHFKANFRLAFPVILSQLGHIMVNVVDSMMVGQLGTVPLAAASLSNSIFTVILVFGLGISYGITPLVAAADGRKNKNRISLLLINGVMVSVITGVILFLAGYLLSPYLYFLDQPEAVVALTIPYLNICFFSLIPLMVFQGFKQFAEGLSLTKQSMYISVFANALNIIGNYILIYGKFGAPALGFIGAAISTLLARVIMAGIMGIYILYSEELKPYRLHWERQFISMLYMFRIVKLGFPISVQMLFEMGAFSFSAVMIGWLGAKELAAHQIAISIASVTYMMASGIAAAATIRVGNLFGQGYISEMRSAGFISFIMAVAFMSVCGLILIIAKNFIPQLYIQDQEVITLAAGLLIIAALFQISDGVQVVGLGALRGLEDVKVPSIISLLAYWVLGLPMGYILCFRLGFGVNGIWTGLLAGLSLAALLIFLRFKKLSLVK
ncbi:MATE family efflux transporter [Adhaeribacter aquaticus]|uniref:MATE family efflux transporter n=1 Tax=Adhaeribacter aquaticus TaxID=299567 RepID=UPI000412657F|nr:MATE family efflux transporter [Adhaeribacter aquaticus]